MSRTAEQYRKLLSSLLPKGRFWSRRSDSILQKLLLGLADEFVRIEDRTEDLYEEQDTRTATELLPEHELDYGLPKSGEEIAETNAQRREELQAALLKVGQQYPQYVIDIAAALGYTITIEQHTPFWTGYSLVGESVGDQNNIFWWTVLIDLSSVTESAEVNITKLVSRIKEIAPGHSHVDFRFTGAEFSRAFSSAFDRIPHYDNSWLNGEFSRDFDDSFANAYDYDGENYTGSFSYDFSIAFDRHSGGEFNREFDTAFSKQH